MDLAALRRRLEGPAPSRSSAAGRREAAVALVLAWPGPELLLIRRCEDPRDHWSGHMALPGGRRDPGDAGLLETAVRETREETGIALSGESLLGELDDLCPENPALPPVLVRPFVFGLPRKPAVRPSGEVAAHFWVPVPALVAGEAEIEAGGKPRRVRGYQVGTELVWGITERILTGFLARL
jgi:8-oxo-dGTP pyrophosphatase MutT (NUDIX family)